MIQGVIQTYITFDGTLNSCWTKIAVGFLVFLFIAWQNVLTSGRDQFGFTRRLKRQPNQV